MKEENGMTATPVEPIVSRMVAVEDSRFVLEWLLQMHECESIKFRLPENIEGLSRRALKLFNAADESDYDAADPVPISDDRIREIVKYATGG